MNELPHIRYNKTQIAIPSTAGTRMDALTDSLECYINNYVDGLSADLGISDENFKILRAD